MLDTLSLPGTFGLYAAVSLAGAVALYLVLPETEGRTLQEIQEHFAGSRDLLRESKPKASSKWAADNLAMENVESRL